MNARAAVATAAVRRLSTGQLTVQTPRRGRGYRVYKMLLRDSSTSLCSARNDKTGTGKASPSARIIRRNDDCDGWHRRRGNLRESLRGGASGPCAVPDPRRLGSGRLDRDVWSVYLG